MNFDEQKLKRLDNIRLNDNQYENVIRLPDQYTLKTYTKKIRTLEMKVSGVFYGTKLWGVFAILHMGLNAFVAFEVRFCTWV